MRLWLATALATQLAVGMARYGAWSPDSHGALPSHETALPASREID